MTDTAAAPVKLDLRDARNGRFLPGNKSGGRKVGARTKLSEQFLSDLFDEWKFSGKDALSKMAKDDASGFVKVVANLIPAKVEKTFGLDENIFSDVSDFVTAYQLAREFIGVDRQKLIDAKAIDDD